MPEAAEAVVPSDTRTPRAPAPAHGMLYHASLFTVDIAVERSVVSRTILEEGTRPHYRTKATEARRAEPHRFLYDLACSS